MPTLRLATLNLRDLQLAERPTHANARTWNRAEYREKVAWTAEMVGRLDADVVAFQELWTPRALHDVFDAAGTAEAYALVTTPSIDRVGARTSVAIAVRAPLTVVEHTWVTDFPRGVILRKRSRPAPQPDEEMELTVPRFARPLLRVVIEGGGLPAQTVFAVHLKSRRPVDLDPEDGVRPEVERHALAIGHALSAARRAAEAVGLRAVVDEARRARPGAVALLGDLNGPIGGETLGGDIERGRALGLNAVATRGDEGGERGERGEGPFTYVNQGDRIVLDHVLVSDEYLARPFTFTGYTAFNEHLVAAEGMSLPRHVSDHAGVVAEFGVGVARG